MFAEKSGVYIEVAPAANSISDHKKLLIIRNCAGVFAILEPFLKLGVVPSTKCKVGIGEFLLTKGAWFALFLVQIKSCC